MPSFKKIFKLEYLAVTALLSACATDVQDTSKNTVDIQKLEQKAESGSAEALNELGENYHFGHGVKQDFAKAHDLYIKAVAKGYAPAANHLGRLYANGEGVTQNPKEAKKWYKKSAELDPSDWNKCINGVHKNKSFCALQYLNMSPTPIPAVQYELAKIYYSGDNFVPSNPKKAFDLFSEAAEQGDPQACHVLYQEYRNGGKLVAKNEIEAEKWRLKAKELWVGEKPFDLRD